jgi:hypothetical protein
VKAYLATHFDTAARIAEEMPDPNGPDPWSHEDPAAPPLITVQDDTGPTLWPVWSEPVIRITIHANGKQTAKNLRRRAMGAMLEKGAIPDLFIAWNGIGYVDGRDPDTGADLASFTVTATVRTEVITV